jgi:hypothetical protein
MVTRVDCGMVGSREMVPAADDQKAAAGHGGAKRRRVNSSSISTSALPRGTPSDPIAPWDARRQRHVPTSLGACGDPA